MNDYEKYLAQVIPEKDCLKTVKAEAKRFYETHSPAECLDTGMSLYQSENFQIQETGVLLLGYCDRKEALEFLRDEASRHPSWKVQEVVAMAFDNHCRLIGYKNALPLITAWLEDERPNVRRAASEGPRVWTSRPYFKEHPETAIRLLASRREDESEYVRKSVGNALKDIGKKFPEALREELGKWDLSSPRAKQVHKLAGKFIGGGEG